MKKGFTLVELMVVVLIVGILAAVALPLMSGKIDAAKWSEAKAGAGTIVSALRAYGAEQGTSGAWTTLAGSNMGVTATATALGITNNDLEGTYFTPANYVITSCTWSATTGLDCVITVSVTKTNGPAGGPKTLTVNDNVTVSSAGQLF